MIKSPTSNIRYAINLILNHSTFLILFSVRIYDYVVDGTQNIQDTVQCCGSFDTGMYFNPTQTMRTFFSFDDL